MIHNPKKILIVDDNPENIRVVADTLHRDNITLAFAQSGDEALKRLENCIYDLILMDVMMPELDGFETVCKIKEKMKFSQIPIIFLTAKDDEESIEKAFSVGGVDYICKPFRAKELIVRVQHQLERKDFLDKLDYLASYDVLTGLFNRRKFYTLAIELFKTREANLYGVIMDVDHFKSVNDTYGHQNGDKILQKIASIIKDNIPNEGILGRVGGEEFALIFTSESLENAKYQVDKIRQSIENNFCSIDDSIKLHCTISIGLAEKTEDINTIDKLLHEADEALYGAKNSGRNCIRVQTRS